MTSSARCLRGMTVTPANHQAAGVAPLCLFDIFGCCLYVCLNLTQDFGHLLFFGFGVVLFLGHSHTWGLHRICGGRALCCPSNSWRNLWSFGAPKRRILSKGMGKKKQVLHTCFNILKFKGFPVIPETKEQTQK